MIPDFINFNLAKCKELIAKYQKDKDADSFNILLAKFDRYILYVIYEMKKSYPYLQNEDMQELYHTGILGFSKGITAFKLHLDVSMIILVIKAYIKSEIKQTYAYKNKELSCNLSFASSLIADPLAELNNILVKEKIFSSSELTDDEKEMIHLRFFEGKDVKDIAQKQGVKPTTMFKRMSKLLVRVKKIVGENFYEEENI